MRALLHFAEEEAKHIQLFKWFVQEFEKGFGTPCGAIGPAKEIAAAILNHSRLGVFLATLQIEWMTQKHYLESVKDNAAEGLDPLFCSLLKHHWLEESQHAKLDTLVVDEIASGSTPAEIEAGIDDYMAIGKILDGGLTAQVQLDLESLQKAIGRTLSARGEGGDHGGPDQGVPLDVPRERDDPSEVRPEPARAERAGPRARRRARARRRLTVRR